MNFTRGKIDAVIDSADFTALSAFAQSWLERQCALLPGSGAGLVLLRDGGVLRPVGLWPSAAAATGLVELSERVARERAPLVADLPQAEGASGARSYGIAYPLQESGEIVAVAAIAVSAGSEKSLQTAMRQLQWGSAGLELELVKREGAQIKARAETLELSVDLLSFVLAEERFEGAAMAFVTALTTTLAADRVSLGLIKNGAVKVRHISHSSQFGQRMNLVRMIEKAMDETIDQRAPIRLPHPDSEKSLIRRAHEEILSHEPECILTLPLYIDGEAIAALMLERAPENPFSDADVALVESVSALSVAALEQKRLNDRPIIVKAGASLRQLVAGSVGKRYLGWKAIAAIVLVGLYLLATVQAPDRIGADAVLEASTQRVLAAPFDGFVRTAEVRSGDRVKKGDLIASLDDTDLALERSRWLSQLGRIAGMYKDAAAKVDSVQLNALAAERAETQAQLDLVQALIARAQIRAPYDGLIVSGDLSQRIGGNVTKGEVLFTVAPSADYRVQLAVRESRISGVRAASHGVLYLSALPARAFPITIEKITPVTVSQNGATYFTVEASLDGAPDQALQPGMRGVGRIDSGRGTLLTSWSRDLMEWLRLKFWLLAG